jgi:linoleoyl-CoA desaturase
MRKITFAKDHNAEFYRTLQLRVRAYFKDNNISKYGNFSMVLKTIIILSAFVLPFLAITFLISNVWLSLASWFFMSFAMAGIGFSIMHDANHGTYSKYKSINRALGFFVNYVGGSSKNWRIQHNILHHTFTNVHEMDDDLNAGPTLRLAPHAERKAYHKYQQYYAWFLYMLMTILWITTKDIKSAIRYKKMDLTKTQNKSFTVYLSIIIGSKLVYYFTFLVLPLIFAPLAWYFVVIGFVLMHFICGLIFALVFQPAHVVPSSPYNKPDDSGYVDADWAVNQLFNTANFATKAKLLSWYVGGLNFQVEHHLFPNVCHVHYKKLAAIVEQTAKEYNLPYFNMTTFKDAIVQHKNMLRDLGRYDNAPAIEF